jgi:hypothetical protein
MGKQKGGRKKGTKARSLPPISREITAVEQSLRKKQMIEQKMQRFVSWTALTLLIFVNFLGALLLVPFLLFFEGLPQYVLIVLFGVGFGLLFNLMIHSIEHLGDKHHIIAGILVPCFALLDLVILFGILDQAVQKFQITITHNYALIVLVFLCAFLIPYGVDILRRKHTI